MGKFQAVYTWLTYKKLGYLETIENIYFNLVDTINLCPSYQEVFTLKVALIPYSTEEEKQNFIDGEYMYNSELYQQIQFEDAITDSNNPCSNSDGWAKFVLANPVAIPDNDASKALLVEFVEGGMSVTAGSSYPGIYMRHTYEQRSVRWHGDARPETQERLVTLSDERVPAIKIDTDTVVTNVQFSLEISKSDVVHEAAQYGGFVTVTLNGDITKQSILFSYGTSCFGGPDTTCLISTQAALSQYSLAPNLAL